MRISTIERKTSETDVNIKLNLDGTGIKKIDTGIKFFDHLLNQLATHGFFDIEIEVNSHDKDSHHILEHTTLALGEAFKKALGNKKGINRYGYTIIPMDEALTLCSIDLSGRPYCNFIAEIKQEHISDFETALTAHFFNSFSIGSMSTIHINLLHGKDPHHIIESMFKAFTKALKTACEINKEHSETILSTKGSI